jgi:hypothetical protein
MHAGEVSPSVTGDHDTAPSLGAITEALETAHARWCETGDRERLTRDLTELIAALTTTR